MFPTAVCTFRSGEFTFRNGARTFRSAEYKTKALSLYNYDNYRYELQITIVTQ